MLTQAGQVGGSVSDADLQTTLSWLQSQPPALQQQFTNALSSATLGSNNAVDYGRKLANGLGLGSTGTGSGSANPIDPSIISEPAAKSLLTDAGQTTASTTAGPGSPGLDFGSWQKITTWLAVPVRVPPVTSRRTLPQRARSFS